ncbi:MAG: hypothetical protein GY869_09460, partial [Planctomycetes bacterium]|nr:hypothetical protein [Planctomycetota bacterium]
MAKQTILICCFVFIVAVGIYSLFGLDGDLYGDDALQMYSAQRMAEGIPLYVSAFINIAPLGPMIMGLGVILSRFIGADDFLTVRLLFFFIGCSTVVSIYLLCRYLLGSVRTGLFGAFAFLGFYGFAERTASGPRDKTAMALFQTLGLYFLCRKKWFLAGMFTTMAFLTWQPMGIYPVAALFMALVQPSGQRWRALGRCVAGIALPMSVVLGYFMYHGALNDL